MESAAAAVCRSESGMLGDCEPSGAGFEVEVYSGLSSDCAKNDAFWDTKASAVV